MNPFTYLNGVILAAWTAFINGLVIAYSVPLSRTITIDGVTYDLTSDRSWTTSGGGSTTFIGLTDVPPSYATFGGYGVRVNVGETGLEFYALVASIPLSYLDTDGTLAANSDSKVATQKATKTYADNVSSNASVIAKLLTGFSAGAGTVSAVDSILTAFQKIVGNIALKLTANAPITGATKTKITYDANGLVTSGADATTSDIAEGSNLYYTAARFDTRLATKSTTDLAEGANLYYTTPRFDARLATKTTTDLAEGSNLYFTNGRALAAAPAETTSTIGVLVNGASAAIPNDTDLVATVESSVLKKITWTNIKAFLKTYFDTLYQATGLALLKANNLSDLANAATARTNIGLSTTANQTDSTNKRYVTDADLIDIGNLSGINTGDNAANTTSNSYADAKVSDTVYGASWNAVTTIAPSKNAVYDEIESILTQISLKADDSAVVHLSGAEAIVGRKDFQVAQQFDQELDWFLQVSAPTTPPASFVSLYPILDINGLDKRFAYKDEDAATLTLLTKELDAPKQQIVTVPYGSLFYKTTVIKANMTSSKKIQINWGAFLETDENVPDYSIAFWAVAGTGSYDIYMAAAQGHQFGGSFKFNVQFYI